ncbi:hypothetical protein FGB62_57g14 [Gracilaria domingensis]|nr:hypothetical protein FGB62_57g14 [Gracilaria domingensis]
MRDSVGHAHTAHRGLWRSQGRGGRTKSKCNWRWERGHETPRCGPWRRRRSARELGDVEDKVGSRKAQGRMLKANSKNMEKSWRNPSTRKICCGSHRSKRRMTALCTTPAERKAKMLDENQTPAKERDDVEPGEQKQRDLSHRDAQHAGAGRRRQVLARAVEGVLQGGKEGAL